MRAKAQSRAPVSSARGSRPHPRGSAGETLAVDYLQKLGFRIVGRNWRSPQTRHELDIVAEDGPCLVFVEVKTARTREFGDPVTWVNQRKQAVLAKAAISYIATERPRSEDYRFDVIAIAPGGRGRPRAITHIRSAFMIEPDTL